MNYKDLEELLDKIEVDSMCRDEIFYDTEYGYESRRVQFFKNIRRLQEYFDGYLSEEENLMKGIEFDKYKYPIIKHPKEKTKDEKQLWEIMKTVNSYSRREEEDPNID